MKLSIVLSGGSSKGAYQIGFYKALNELQLGDYVKIVSATSIGCINSYAFLANKIDEAEEMQRLQPELLQF